jgi:hypothetical protein
MSDTITGRSVVTATKDQVSSDLGGETVILNLSSGVYFGLDLVGTHIWNQIQEPRTVAELRDSILEKYDVEPERCERDLLALLEELKDDGLIEVRGEPDS